MYSYSDPFATAKAVLAGQKELLDDGHRTAPLEVLFAAALIILRRDKSMRVVDLYPEASARLGMGLQSPTRRIAKELRSHPTELPGLLSADEEAQALIGWFIKNNFTVPAELR